MNRRALILLLAVSLVGNVLLAGLYVQSRSSSDRELNHYINYSFTNAAQALREGSRVHANGYLYTAKVLLLGREEDTNSTFITDVNELSYYMGMGHESVQVIIPELIEVLENMGKDYKYEPNHEPLRTLINRVRYGK